MSKRAGVCLLVLMAAQGAPLAAAVAVTTQHNDLNRTGANLNETLLNTSNVNVADFGKLFSRSVDGQIYAQPLYVPSVTIPGQGVHNVLYVCTEHDSVYAFDADDPAASAPLWHVSLGPSLPAAVVGSTHDLTVEIGITSTPVIDLSSSTIYVVAETYESNNAIFRLHALDIATGSEKFGGPAVIQGSVAGTGISSSNGSVPFEPLSHWQRPGLLLTQGNVYVAFASHQDSQPYHGWIFAYSATTLQRTAILCTSPDSDASGVWQSGAGLAADATGFIYLQTGNGLMDVNTGGEDYGDSVVKLNTTGGLAVADYFSPSNQAQLEAGDVDLGSSGPLLIPGTTLGVAAGKDGRVFLWNTSNLGQFHSTDQLVQEWQASTNLFAGNVYYNRTLYVWGMGDALKAFAFNGSSFNTTPVSQSTFAIPNGFPNTPAMSVSANGTNAGTMILWAAYSANGPADGFAYPGILRAFDASNVSRELWNSNQNQARDSSGSWAKWVAPTVANGKVYLATFDNIVNAYGLMSGSSVITATGGTPQSATVNTVFTTPFQATVKDAGNNPVSGVTVTFTAPTSGASGTFNGSVTAAVVTNSSGVATAPTFTANGTAGNYTVSAGISGAAPASFSLINNAVVSTGGGSLIGSGNSLTTAANLTTEGTSDWMHWGDGSVPGLNRKSGVTAQLSIYTMVGSRGVSPYPNDLRPMSWSDGNPTASSANNTNGVYTSSVGNGFSITAPADTNSRTLTMHVGGWNSGGTLTAQLSDGSAASFVDTTTTITGEYDRNYTLRYNAASAGQTLMVTWVMASGTGNVNLNGAALAIAGATAASVTATAGTPQSATVNTAFTTALQATVKDSGSNPLSGVTVTFTALGSGASGTFSGTGTGTATAVTNGSGVATASTLTANGTAGGYTVTASVAGVGTPASFNLTNNAVVSTGGGSLSGSGNSLTTAANLTTEGTSDWMHWGDGSMNRKTGVTAQLSDYTMVGSEGVSPYPNDPRPLSWTDGTPTASSADNTNGVYISSVGNGFSITAPADTNSRTLTVHVGGWFSGGTLTAQLSDGSAANFVDTTATTSGSYDRNYTLRYNASSVGQKLTVTWVMASSTSGLQGNVTLNGAALAVAAITPASITATAGTPQSAPINKAFTTALQATVKDASGNALGGVTVTFTAVGSGASGTFSGTGTATATAVTNGSGVATAPAFTANGTAGSYTVTANAAGVATPANFSLTNNAATAASVTATSGTPQSATVNTAFTTALQATVKDSGSNPLSGVTVTFTALGSGASGTFTGTGTATAVTNGSGVATAPAFTANGTAGGYTVTASVAGVGSPASFNLTNNAVVSTGGGSLSGSGNSLTTAANLTTEGTSDWMHWGDGSVPGLNRKSGVTAQLSDYTVVGSGVLTPYPNDLRPLSWSDGTPTTGSTNNTNGLYISSVGNGFSITAPADTNSRTLTMHVGGWNSGCTLTAQLSDGSAANFADTTTTTTGEYDRNYTLRYNAASAGQTLTVTWVMASGTGNVNLNGAALAIAAITPASITATAGTPQSATINKAFTTALQATVKDASGNALGGVTVTFTAIGSGAGGTFSGTGTATATAVTNGSGVATAAAFTANGTAGGYTVTASVAGVGSPASFNLTNNAVVSTGGGSLIGSGNSLATAANLTTEGSSDWMHWGDGSLNRKAGVTAQLSDYTVVGSGVVSPYPNDLRPLSWTDGTPTASSTNNTNGVYISSVGNGFSITAPADTKSRTLTVHVGGWFSGGTLTAQLSDGSAANLVDTTAPVSGQYDRNYTLSYNAASAGQTLTVTWVMASGPGNVTLNGAGLAGAGATAGSITATAGTPQSATVNTAFTTALQATVKDSDSNPLGGVMVTFTALGSGASGTFSGTGTATATAVTNGSGVATAPALAANGTAGSYAVTASAAGVGAPASFNLTNNAVVVMGGLSGSGNSLATTADLTTEGTSDWVHWGDANANRKAGVTGQLSDYAVVGSGVVSPYPNDPRPLSWTDGTPTASSIDNTNGVYISDVGSGFSITAPADTNSRTLTVHVGGWFSGGTLTAQLSDGSAANFVDTTTPVSRQYDRNYTLVYNAASAGQTLTVTWVMATSTGSIPGNVTLSGAGLR